MLLSFLAWLITLSPWVISFRFTYATMARTGLPTLNDIKADMPGIVISGQRRPHCKG